MSKENLFKIGIIGLGNMGGALLSGIINSDFLKSDEISVFDIDSEKIKKYTGLFNIKSLKSIKEIIISSRYILIAVKPQNINEIAAVIKNSVNNKNKKTILSIAAGLSTGFFERNAGDIPVIRIMPNTPALYRKGIAAVSAGKFATEDDINFSMKLMQSVGETILIEEKYQNVATAVSGSGPAYFFLFCKYMIDFATEHGLDYDTAKKMAVLTMTGAGEVLINSYNPIDELIKSVVSPGGTTEKALNKFEDRNLKEIFFEALDAAYTRSTELESVILKK